MSPLFCHLFIALMCTFDPHPPSSLMAPHWCHLNRKYSNQYKIIIIMILDVVRFQSDMNGNHIDASIANISQLSQVLN